MIFGDILMYINGKYSPDLNGKYAEYLVISPEFEWICSQFDFRSKDLNLNGKYGFQI